MPLPSVPASLPDTLDALPSAFAAYSTARKLRDAYAGQCLRLRKTGDTESDIGFTAEGAIDEAAITAFVGASDAWVVTIYDQSGNGRDLTQATAASQPKLVTAGVINRLAGKPCPQFREDSLQASLGTSLSNATLTFSLVMQVKAASLSTTSRIMTLSGTGGLQAWALNGDFRLLSYGGGGASSQLDDSADRWFGHIRPQHVLLRTNSGDISLWYNGVDCESFTVTQYGGTSTTFILGSGDAGSYSDIAELIVYDQALSDTEMTTLYATVNQTFTVGPNDPVQELALRDRWPWDAVISHWMNGLTDSNLEVTPGTLSWDGTYADTDELYDLWLWLDGTKVNNGMSSTMLYADPVWFKRNPDPSGSGGMESAVTTAEYRQFEVVDQNTGANTLALFYSKSLPKAGGTEGNPYYQQRSVAIRAVVAGVGALMRFMKNSEQAAGLNFTDFIGGNLMHVAFTFRLCRDAMPLHVQHAIEDLLYYTCQRLWWLPAHGINSNMDMKAIAGLAQSWLCFSDEARKTTCTESARRILFGTHSATPETTDKSIGLFSKAGYIVEGESPETTYNGVSLLWGMEAYRVTYGEPDWDFLDDVIQAMVKFKMHQYFIDPDGYQDGPSGYAGRTGNSYVYDQGREYWRDANVVASSVYGKPLGASLGNEAAIDTLIDSAITYWNTTQDVGGANLLIASGSGAAHTGGSASATVTLTNSPNLASINVDNNSEQDWIGYIWLDVDGGRWSRITSFDNTAKTVTGNITFNVAAGSPVDYRIEKGPKTWGADHSEWPPDNLYGVPDGTYDATRALILASDPSLDTVWESSASHNVNFADEFWSYKANDGSRDFGFFIEAIEDPGVYDGWYGGTLQIFWTRDTGTIISSRHNKSGNSGGVEHTRVFSDVDNWATTHIYAIDAGDKGFSSAAFHGTLTSPSVTYDINGTPKSVVVSRTHDPAGGVEAGFQAGTGLTGDLTVTNTFEATASGVRHLTEIANSGSDTIKELWAVIPVYLRDLDQSMSDTTIEYWNGSAWASLSTTLVSTDAIRLMRNFGAGAKYAYVDFASSQSVKLNAAVWEQSYQGNSRHRMIKIDLLGYTGSAQAFPATASVDYSVVTTNPHP